MRIYIASLTSLMLICAAAPVIAVELCDGSPRADDPYTTTTWPQDNNNETITDSNTGLTWSKCFYGAACSTPQALTWSEALAETDTKWRLPNIKELQSIVEYGNNDPAANATCFPNFPAGDNNGAVYVWSSSPVAGNTGNAWVINFTTGAFLSVYPQSTPAYVRFVCDGDAATCNTSPPAPAP